MPSLDFEQIVDRFYPMLYRFALSLAHHEADACDLTQQTFSIWASKGHLLRDASKVKTWLFTTLYREFLSERRREMRWPRQEISEVEHELPSMPSESGQLLNGAEVLTALQSIDETFRAPLVLFYLQEHSYEEIAAILDIPMGTVMSRISRGKQKLHQAVLQLSGEQKSKIIPMRPPTGGQAHG